MKTYSYSYSDSVAGMQSVKFQKLSEMVKYIEDFTPEHSIHEESTGIIYENDRPVLAYASDEDGLTWNTYEE